jgi:prepilin-type N-terminal cleavage/methylation domain-containing protein
MHKGAFTLIELLVVIAIMAIMAALLIPAISSLNNAANINAATYQVKGLLESSRSYATANNTYVWVGFFEEASVTPGAAGTGRIVISVVASTDGTTIYTLPLAGPTPLDQTPARLLQVEKLIKINNMHINVFTKGTGAGSTFDTRPAVSAAQQISPAVSPSLTTFRYPVGSVTPQYTFSKAIQFSPRGEATVDNSSNAIALVVEIGLQPTHGTLIDAENKNVAAVQITGVAGNVNIYRR